MSKITCLVCQQGWENLKQLRTMNYICSRLYIHNYFYVLNPCGINHDYNNKKHVHRFCSVTHLWKSWQRWQNTLNAFALCVSDYMTQRNEGKGTVLVLSSPTSAPALSYIDRWWWYKKSFIKHLIYHCYHLSKPPWTWVLVFLPLVLE